MKNPITDVARKPLYSQLLCLPRDVFQLPRNVKRLMLILMDALLLPATLWLAITLRLGEWWPGLSASWVFFAVPLVSIPVFVRLGLYRAVIRYIGGKAVFTVLNGVSLSVLLLCALAWVFELRAIPWTAFGIYWALALLYIGGSRLMVRNYYQNFYQEQIKSPKRRERIVIFGAGSAGVQLAMGLLSGREYKPVAFVDEKSDLIGSLIQGIRVFPPSMLPQLVRNKEIGQILLAMPSASRERRKEIIKQLEPLPVQVKTIPGLADLVAGKAEVDDIQDIEIEDLLGRDPVPPDEVLLSKCIKGKVVMVTGAGGSIGSELCRQILPLGPKRLVLFELSEYALYCIEKELIGLRRRNSLANDVELDPVLGSATHRKRIESVMRSFGVQTVYHAAAYKHVPLVEHNPIEGVQNNVFGTLRAAEAARAVGVEIFVLISTDKAVRPANVMGATKRIAEAILQALAKEEGSTRFCMVRFGNVLDSSGSVVPLFREQLVRGGPLTVTHTEITRYFMTIPEAAQLVLQAGSMGKDGDVFVLDMGAPVRIVDLARRMIKLSGLEVKDAQNPNGDIEIKFMGLRPGEKLHEELLIGDNVFGTDHPLIMRAIEARIPWAELAEMLRALEWASIELDSAEVRRILESIVAGYRPKCEIIDPVWLKLTENRPVEVPKIGGAVA